MKISALCDSLTRTALRTAWLEEALAPVSEYGREVYVNLEPFAPGQEALAQAHAERVAAMARDLPAEGFDALREVLRAAPDASPAISRASAGDTLDDAQFLEMQRFLDCASRACALLGNAPAELEASIEACAPLAAELEPGRHGKFGFYLSDSFGRNLRQLRDEAKAARQRYEGAHAQLIAGVAAELGRAEIAQDEFIVMRDRMPSRFPAHVRVRREAPTYVLCAIELDDSTLEALRARDQADARVALAEESVRADLSQRIAHHVPALENLMHELGSIDVLVAQARFCEQHACTAAEICADPGIAFDGARFIPLLVELAREGREYEPIDIDLRGTAVLTGPNMGGKSVALRTCGFMALLAAFGIPVPARRARVALFAEIAWIGTGAESVADGLLSSFAREVLRLRDVLARGTARTLVLGDEFARTTTPQEGRALLVALAHDLRQRGGVALLATHLAGVAAASGVPHYAVRGLRDVPRMPSDGDLATALAALARSMDYRIEPVQADAPAQADALALAQLLGLDASLVDAARRHLQVR